MDGAERVGMAHQSKGTAAPVQSRLLVLVPSKKGLGLARLRHKRTQALSFSKYVLVTIVFQVLSAYFTITTSTTQVRVRF